MKQDRIHALIVAQWHAPCYAANNLSCQTVRTNFHSFGGEMAKQKQYPEVYLGEPEVDFVMLAKSQGIQGPESGSHRPSRPP